jgi:hypothetical protein
MAYKIGRRFAVVFVCHTLETALQVGLDVSFHITQDWNGMPEKTPTKWKSTRGDAKTLRLSAEISSGLTLTAIISVPRGRNVQAQGDGLGSLSRDCPAHVEDM